MAFFLQREPGNQASALVDSRNAGGASCEVTNGVKHVQRDGPVLADIHNSNGRVKMVPVDEGSHMGPFWDDKLVNKILEMHHNIF